MRFPLPDGASPEAVAAGINPGMASWLPLQVRQAEAGKLTTVLVLGVTGLSGFLAAQNALLLGAARVVGAGRSRLGLDRAAAAGAEPVTLTGSPSAMAPSATSPWTTTRTDAGAGKSPWRSHVTTIEPPATAPRI